MDEMNWDEWEVRRTWRAFHKEPIVPDKVSGYDDLILSLGIDIVGSLVLGSYQGDTIYLVKEGPYYGYLVNGYGSCSGCDSFEASRDSAKDLTELRDVLENNIQWEPNLQELKRWVEEHDWKGDYFTEDSDEIKEQLLNLIAQEEK